MPRPLVLAALLFSLASAAAEPPSKPAVVWASDPINPGETVLVTGAGFGDKPVVEVGRCDDAAGEAGALPAQMQKVDVLQPNDTSLKFRIPPEFKPGIFAYRITGPNGQVTGTLNRPVIWWAQGDAGAAASPGGWIRLFGKNLGGSAGVPPARAAAPTTVLLGSLRLAAEADCYAAKVALPNDLPPGDYQVSLANGCGGARGVAEAVKIAVQPRPAWPAETFNVRDFGAEGTGRDDTEALKAALAKAEEKGGGVVFLPRGRYKVSDALAIPRFTVLRGEKTELSCLCWADFPKPPFALLKGTNSFAIEDLTLYAHNHQHILAGDQGDKADAGNVRLRRVRVRANAYRGHLKEAEVDERFRNSMKWSTGGGDTVRLGGENLEITGCDLYGSGRALYLSRTRGGLVAGNTFYNGRWGWYCISGSDGLIFENNELAGGDLMSTGGGLNCLDGSPFSQNVYLHHNKFRLMHGWDREAMTSDAGGEVYFGKIASASQTEVVLPEAPKWGKRSCQGMAVLVLDGRGAGQCRRLVSYQGANVTLDRAWDVQLDESSVLGITMYQGHYLILDNEFTDTGAMQFYGTSIECIAAQNTGARMQGFRGLGLWYHGYQPSWFCQFLDNRILDGNYYHWDAAEAAFIEVNGAKRPPLEGPLNRASVLRRNQLAGNAHLQVTGLCSDVIVEHNAVADADMGVFVSENCAHVLVRENTFTNVKHELMDEPAIRKAAEEFPADRLQCNCAFPLRRTRLRPSSRPSRAKDRPAASSPRRKVSDKRVGNPCCGTPATKTRTRSNIPSITAAKAKRRGSC
ncbi:MAG: glycosyl hydrolase family 28-related protein [Planctomycetota bacterium]